jgi:hypothetical protein
MHIESKVVISARCGQVESRPTDGPCLVDNYSVAPLHHDNPDEARRSSTASIGHGAIILELVIGILIHGRACADHKTQ